MKNFIYLFVITIVIFSSSLNAQWVNINVPFGGNVNCFAVSGTNLFAGTQGGGVFLSNNDGTSWQAAEDSFPDEIVECIAINDSNIFAGTSGVDGVIYLSTNNGRSWNIVFGSRPYSVVSSLVIIDSNVFAGTVNFSYNVYRSSNNGTTWIADDTTFNGGGGIRAFAVSGKNIFAGTNTGVYLSTNNGLSWSPVNNGLPDSVHNYCRVTTLAVSPNGAGGNNLFAGTDSNGVFLSINNGSSWAAIGMTNTYINALAVNGTNLFVGTHSGVWRRPLSELITGVEDQSNGILSQFILNQNYPNPFNPTTNIEFRIADFGFVSLKVYDVLGREVATLVNEEKQNGIYTVDFDAATFSSGIYFYTLKAGKFVETKKLILMK